MSWLMLLLLLDGRLSDALVTVLHCVLLNLFQNISSFILTYSCITHAHHQRKFSLSQALSYFYSDRCFNIFLKLGGLLNLWAICRIWTLQFNGGFVDGLKISLLRP